MCLRTLGNQKRQSREWSLVHAVPSLPLQILATIEEAPSSTVLETRALPYFHSVFHLGASISTAVDGKVSFSNSVAHGQLGLRTGSDGVIQLYAPKAKRRCSNAVLTSAPLLLPDTLLSIPPQNSMFPALPSRKVKLISSSSTQFDAAFDESDGNDSPAREGSHGNRHDPGEVDHQKTPWPQLSGGKGREDGHEHCGSLDASGEAAAAIRSSGIDIGPSGKGKEVAKKLSHHRAPQGDAGDAIAQVATSRQETAYLLSGPNEASQSPTILPAAVEAVKSARDSNQITSSAAHVIGKGRRVPPQMCVSFFSFFFFVRLLRVTTRFWLH